MCLKTFQVREKKAGMGQLKTVFVRRASEFLKSYFASLVDLMLNDKIYFSQVLLTIIFPNLI